MKTRSCSPPSATDTVTSYSAIRARLRRRQKQYVLNRQLIDALAHSDANAALALIHAGADPNTRAEPTPPPSLKCLLHQHRRRLAPSIHYSPTALMIVCVPSWYPPLDRSLPNVEMEESLPLLEAMLVHGADIHTGALDNHTALHYAAWMERIDTVKMLLQHGADINVQDERGQTPLMAAIYNDTANMARLLLSHGANPNVQDVGGGTALYYAIKRHNANGVVADLLKHGANPNMRDMDGDTPLQLAQEMERPDLVALMQNNRK